MYQLIIVEDEPLLCTTYQLVLKNLYKKNKINAFESHITNKYSDALDTINSFIKSNKSINLCILDYRLERGEKARKKNGLTIGHLILKSFPKCKIIVITSISDKYLFQTIINELRPSGFFIKSEISFKSIEKDISAIIKGKMVYSKSISNYLKKGIFTNINNEDLKIIYLMSEGHSLLEIAEIIGLSLSGMEYRKRRIAEKLGSKSSKIKDILALAKEELNIL